MKTERYRNEWKYLIDTAQKELICKRLSPYLELDKHAQNGGYMIRSLYFDDYLKSAYEEKDAGVLKRKKYRIRIYNCSDSSIKLERKKKYGSYIYKEAASLTREEVYKILDGDYDFLLKSGCRSDVKNEAGFSCDDLLEILKENIELFWEITDSKYYNISKMQHCNNQNQMYI